MGADTSMIDFIVDVSAPLFFYRSSAIRVTAT